MNHRRYRKRDFDESFFGELVESPRQTVTCPVCLRQMAYEYLREWAAAMLEQRDAEEADKYWREQELPEGPDMTDAEYFASDMAYDAARERAFFPRR